jgi:hypothetical protein
MKAYWGSGGIAIVLIWLLTLAIFLSLCVCVCDYSIANSWGHAGTRVKAIFICYFLPLSCVVMTHLALLCNKARARVRLRAAVGYVATIHRILW